MLLRDMICQTSARTLKEYICLEKVGIVTGNYSFIPLSNITCNLLIEKIDVNFITKTLETDLRKEEINAILSKETLSADLTNNNEITGDITCH